MKDMNKKTKNRTFISETVTDPIESIRDAVICDIEDLIEDAKKEVQKTSRKK